MHVKAFNAAYNSSIFVDIATKLNNIGIPPTDITADATSFGQNARAPLVPMITAPKGLDGPWKFNDEL